MSDFCGNLFWELNKNAKNDNVFFSPYSISMCLSMILHGAEGDSKTQLIKGLGFTENSDILKDQKTLFEALHDCSESIELNIANKIFPASTFSIHEKYKHQLKDSIGCQVQPMDYQKEAEFSRTGINQWVEQVTKNKIKNLLGPGTVDSLTRMVLVNAIYFKGLWSDQFEKRNTRPQDFHCMDGSVNKVQMMSRKAKYFNNYDNKLKVQCVKLPYKGNNFSMCIFLPDARFGVADIEKKLTTGKMKEMLKSCGLEEMIVKLPRFKFEYEKTLNDTLKALGIDDIFDDSKANFKGMTDEPALFVSHVAHKAFVEVNEEGTEAAAATGAVMMMRCMPMPPLEFTCDHPFIFTIQHNSTSEVLFFGKVASLVE